MLPYCLLDTFICFINDLLTFHRHVVIEIEVSIEREYFHAFMILQYFRSDEFQVCEGRGAYFSSRS